MEQSQVPQDARTMGMLAHLLGIFSFIGPLIIWLIKKDEHPFVDDQGKEALNFQISLLIYYFISGLLCIILIGLLILPVVVIVHYVFAILAGVKANQGEYYRYPLTIRFIK
ncbi:DUF4870 domain-containing protein [Desmospora activa]|uniref:Tic20 family protein n=1 Tax=Desmospora activa DSM 45169 TaxID=1121389 RepID=A0A2T4Z9D2_9BACL|nr:DUF4870 domain-containing protein [Desmospora activa]PTM58475.1 hypothetical protein C8J48_1058 [Desmospora activa DSM 45169]